MQHTEIERIYVTYGPMVIRRCRALLGHEEDAVEAAQEVFIKVIEHADHLDLEAAPSSLLYRIATNHCLNRIRDAKRRPRSHAQSEELLSQIARLDEDEALSFERRSVISRLFRRQQESTRLIAVLYWIEEMTLEEVAAEVDMSVSGVRKRLRHLRAQLAPAVRELREIEAS